MTNELTTFTHEQFGSVRALNDNEAYWFVATDVCSALELDRTAVRRLDADEKGVRSMHTLGGDQNLTFVSEAGLYSLVLGSRKPEAKAFKRWITHEVIPSIRKTGGYIAGQESMSDSELLAKALLVAQKQIDERNKQIGELKPKALFAEAVSASSTSVLVGDLSKLLSQNGIEMGQKRLFQWLRDNGYLIKQQGTSWNMPTQRAVDMGLIEIKETAVTHADGHITLNRTPKITGKGQVYFVDKFLAQKGEG